MDKEIKEQIKEQGKQQRIENEFKQMDGQQVDYSGDFFNYFTDLIRIKNVPENIRKMLWGLANPVHTITNFEDKDIRLMMREFDTIITVWEMSIPEYECTYDMYSSFRQLEILFYSMIKRSSERGFERRMQATQIQQREVTYAGERESAPSGIRGKVSKFFGGR